MACQGTFLQSRCAFLCLWPIWGCFLWSHYSNFFWQHAVQFRHISEACAEVYSISTKSNVWVLSNTTGAMNNEQQTKASHANHMNNTPYEQHTNHTKPHCTHTPVESWVVGLPASPNQTRQTRTEDSLLWFCHLHQTRSNQTKPEQTEHTDRIGMVAVWNNGVMESLVLH